MYSLSQKKLKISPTQTKIISNGFKNPTDDGTKFIKISWVFLAIGN
jgi:hypothetical protein